MSEQDVIGANRRNKRLPMDLSVEAGEWQKGYRKGWQDALAGDRRAGSRTAALERVAEAASALDAGWRGYVTDHDAGRLIGELHRALADLPAGGAEDAKAVLREIWHRWPASLPEELLVRTEEILGILARRHD